MGKERQWLQAEQGGQEELAEMMFARLVAEIPTVGPSTDFVARTVRAAWQGRTRRRLVRRFALIAAAVLFIAGVGTIYELTVPGISLAARGAVLFSHGLVWLLSSASEGVRWWRIAERIGTAVPEIIAAPSTAATVAAAEMIALLAIYGFQRLVGKDLEATK